LQGASLAKAILCCVGFHQANLEGADLSNANFRGAKLSLCNMSRANFYQAELETADFYKANLRGARNLTDEQLSQVARLWGTIMPDGEIYDGRFNLFGDLDLARWNNVKANDIQAMADFYGVSLENYCQGQGIEVSIVSS
jgi:uncharacterized protein YjbI with pentapeptide repeats